MDDHARALLEHRRQQRAIQPDGRVKVLVEGALPLLVVERSEAARRRRGAADDMHDDVDAVEAIADRVDHGRAAFGGGNIRGNEQIGIGEFGWRRASGGEDLRPELAQARDHRCADPLGAARDERPAAIQFKIVAYG